MHTHKRVIKPPEAVFTRASSTVLANASSESNLGRDDMVWSGEGEVGSECVVSFRAECEREDDTPKRRRKPEREDTRRKAPQCYKEDGASIWVTRRGFSSFFSPIMCQRFSAILLGLYAVDCYKKGNCVI